MSCFYLLSVIHFKSLNPTNCEILAIGNRNLQTPISQKRLDLALQSVLRTDRNMAPIKQMPPLDFVFGHSFAYFQYCACSKTMLPHLIILAYDSMCQHVFITIEISAIPDALFWPVFFVKWITVRGPGTLVTLCFASTYHTISTAT